MLLSLSPDLAVLGVAVVLEMVGREPPKWLHPTVWIGRTVTIAEGKAPTSRTGGFIAGVIIVVAITGLWGAAAYFAAVGLLNRPTCYVISERILTFLKRGDYEGKRVSRSVIFQRLKGPRSTVRRTDDLDEPLAELVSLNWLRGAGNRSRNSRGIEFYREYQVTPKLQQFDRRLGE